MFDPDYDAHFDPEDFLSERDSFDTLDALDPYDCEYDIPEDDPDINWEEFDDCRGDMYEELANPNF